MEISFSYSISFCFVGMEPCGFCYTCILWQSKINNFPPPPSLHLLAIIISINYINVAIAIIIVIIIIIIIIVVVVVVIVIVIRSSNCRSSSSYYKWNIVGVQATYNVTFDTVCTFLKNDYDCIGWLAVPNKVHIHALNMHDIHRHVCLYSVHIDSTWALYISYKSVTK